MATLKNIANKVKMNWKIPTTHNSKHMTIEAPTRAHFPPVLGITREQRQDMRDQIAMEELDNAANVDQLDRPALDQWLTDKRKDQKKNNHKILS